MSHCIPMSLLSDIPYDHNSNETYLGVVLVSSSIGYCLVSTQIYHMHGNVGKKVAVLQTLFNKFHWQLLPKSKGPGKDMTIIRKCLPYRRQTITWTDDGLAIPTQICVPQIRGVNDLIQNRSFLWRLIFIHLDVLVGLRYTVHSRLPTQYLAYTTFQYISESDIVIHLSIWFMGPVY